MMRIRHRKWKKLLAWILCIGICTQNMVVYAADTSVTVPSTMDSENLAIEKESEKNEIDDIRYSGIEENTNLEKQRMDSKEETDFSNVYQDGIIKIYHQKQLDAIGTDEPVRTGDDKKDTFASGDEITENGTVITYSGDVQYQLMNDIELEANSMWKLPEGFTGTFVSETVDETAPLYDPEKDTVYVYHNYQLLTIASDESEKEPIMSKDMIASDFGMGQFLYQDGQPADKSADAAQDYLTYSKAHRYILSKNFTEQMPELKASTLGSDVIWLEGEDAGGRTSPGQLFLEENGEKYILIGNEAQLRAIGTDQHVTPRLYIYNPPGLVGTLFGGDPSYIPYYPGDADLGLEAVAPEGGTEHWEGILGGYQPDEIVENKYMYYEEFAKTELADIDITNNSILGGILDLVGGLLGGLLLGNSEICGVDETGRPNNDKMDLAQLRKDYGNLTYSSNANYIIFRDIDLASGTFSNGQDEDWNPIHLSGKMEGRKGMVQGNVPTISNIHVYQTGKLDFQKDSGVGFFGTISNEQKKGSDGSFESAGRAGVKNLHLNQVTVNNESTEVDDNADSLVEGLTKLLGELLGGLLNLIGEILDGLLPVIGDLKLDKIIRDLLTLKQTSPDMFATGSFVGRIVGDVSIENCTVTNASVTSVKGMSGGFVGYTEGETQYGPLSNLAGGVVELLSTLLNILPGVGLDDLITILLKNDVPLGNLMPRGYYKPTISGCSVSLSKGAMGTISAGEQKESIDYNGGFVGSQTGTDIRDCSVTGLTSVQADIGAGGFAGMEKDAQVHGLLNDLGIEIKTFDIRSTQTNCYVTGDNLSVTVKEKYAGGVNGVMANSSSVKTRLSGLASVTATEYAGGFSGRATLGYGMAVGTKEEQNDTLLQAVSKLLENLLTEGNEEKLGVLLSLSGAQPSEIQGCSVSGNNWSVKTDEKYAGGLIGQGDGVQITDSEGTANVLEGLVSVQAKNYAGGISGAVTTADAIGVLNNTLGVGSYLPFKLSNIELKGSNLQVKAELKYAAGGASLLLGGEADQIRITGLQSVTAGNYAGGFGGRAGSGSLAKEGGLDLLGLGLIKVDNLLSLMDGLATKISNTTVSGTEGGAVICADGKAEITDGESILAGGFISEAEGVQLTGSKVDNIKQIYAESIEGKESFAGGFIGRSHTGGLAGVAQEEEDGTWKLPGIVTVDSLLNLVPYLIPSYKNCTVQYVSNGSEAQVSAQYAGGFFGYMQSGTVDNSQLQEPYSVYGLEYIKGADYAGGYAGKVDAGAAAASDGLKLLGGVLNLDIGNLLSVLNVYIPQINFAGVKSADQGFVVEASEKDSSAGGYIGYGSGVQISNSDVTSLKHTKVTPPSDSLESVNADSYFDDHSSYAVKAGKYAGGYIGCVDIDSAAGVGEGLGLLGGAININDVLSALDVVASNIKDSDVNGCVGGYAVLANGKDSEGNVIGMAGGYAGRSSGTQIKNSDALNFSYIIGQETAGGYVGLLEPGNVASVLKDGSILNGLLDINNLAQVVQLFIPIIEDCQATSIPCGGAVRAHGFTNDKVSRGMAGGFVGYNHGGRITGTTEECAVIRLRSVYGGEFAGGFTGLMENASIADTGNLSVLFGVVSTSNVLGLLQAVYPTETNTAVYGPLRKLDLNTWNAWAQAVASDGVYGYQFPSTPVNSEEELQQLIEKYAYGYNVKAGRMEPASIVYQAGIAGGYAGRISGGVVTEAHAWDAKDIVAYQSVGGFAGEMITEGVAQVGSTSLLGLPLTGTLSVLQTFVPVIRNSDVTGYQSGMSVKATGIPKGTDEKIEKVGYAGGFVGHMVGGQIWGNWNSDQETGISSYSATDAVTDPNNDRCFVANLRQVNGTNAVGGFAGLIDPGSAAALDTSSSSGLLGGLLQKLIGTPGDLLSVLNATLSTVCAVDVKAWDSYGIIIHGAYTNESANTSYAKAVGGFAGEINGAVIGDKDDAQLGVNLENIRSVTGGEHAGGFFGLADVSAVAELTGDGSTSILEDLISLDSVDVLDAFRTYIYDSTVSGTAASGLEVNARDGKSTEYVNNKVYTGNAGGFGGTLLNGTVKGCKVENLRQVNALNYAGGFVGHLGKSGVVDLGSLGVFNKLVSVGAGVLDIFGSYVVDSTVSGLTDGYTVKSENQSQDKSEIAGGFAGYADLAKLDRNTVQNLKQVASGETAGGFAGKTSFAYLADIKADSYLVNQLIDMLNNVLKALWVEDLQEGNIIKIHLGILTVDALYDGNLVHLNLLGLDIKIALAKEKQLATVYIGDSKVEVNCSKDGITGNEDKLKDEINVQLIKANRTRISECSVTGVSQGYDVYGGGAGNKNNGSGENGYAGGFVGYNNEGLLKNNDMYYADVIRGTKGITGPFTGSSSLESSWNFNTLSGIEGEGNQYRIYRDVDNSYNLIKGSSGNDLQDAFEIADPWNVYTITHLAQGKVEKFTDLKDAVMSSEMNENQKMLLNAYMEDGAMAVLMANTATSPTEPGDESMLPDVQDPCADTVKLYIQKVWKNDKKEDRPEQIILHITRSYTDSEGKVIPDEQFNQEVTLNKSDYQSEDTWEKILSGDLYTAYHVGENGEKYYYTYMVSEDVLDGYKTTISYSDEYHYNIKIINEKSWFDSLLPETGGVGTTWIYTIGVLLLCFVAAMEYKHRKSKRRQSSYK